MIRTKPERKTAKWDPRNLSYGPDKIYVELPGTMLLTVGRYLAPSPETIRDHILELRTTLHWTQAYLAAILGVPLITLRSWEDGHRTPTGAPRKLIWLIWAIFIEKKPMTDRDIADWGHEVGSVRVDQIDAMIARICSQSETQNSATGKPPSQAPQNQP